MTKAWIGDWYERVKERARERGFDTVTAFADSQPTASLLVLADTLGKDDVAAAQLEKVLVDEAEDSGTMERCARSLLVRRLHQKLPEGWQAEWMDDGPHSTAYRRVAAFSDVAVAIGQPYKESMDRIWEALKIAEIPEGWLPEGPDDPILVDLFRQHWHEPMAQQASDAPGRQFD